MKKVRIGIIGVGGIATGVHIPGYLAIPDECEITAICDSKETALRAAAKKLNIPESRCFHNYIDLINCGDVDAVDICTPNYLHCAMAKQAVLAGKPFSVEKPVGMNYKEVKELCDLSDQNKIPAFVCFTWRYNKFIRFIKSIIDSGEIGELYHIYIRCIKDSGLWEGRKLEWRFDEKLASSGVLCDLGSHMVDITRFLGYEFKSVFADRGTIVKTRQREDSEEYGEVTTDDWCNMIARLDNGVSATIQVSRTTTTVSNLFEIELYGSNGMIKFYGGADMKIDICTGKTDMQGKGTHTIIPPAKFDAIQSKSFVDLVNGKVDEYTSRIHQGLGCQAALDAALKSCEVKRFVDVGEVK